MIGLNRIKGHFASSAHQKAKLFTGAEVEVLLGFFGGGVTDIYMFSEPLPVTFGGETKKKLKEGIGSDRGHSKWLQRRLDHLSDCRTVKFLLLWSDLVPVQGLLLVLEKSNDVLVKELCAEQKLLSKSRRDWGKS